MTDGDARRLRGLIGRAPDPIRDRGDLIALGDASRPAVRRVVAELHTREDWRGSRLGALLPGLDLLRSPRLGDLLGVRAANVLGREGVIGWRALAARSPGDLAALEDVGPVLLREVLGVAAREWAAAYLRAEADGPPSGPAGDRGSRRGEGRAIGPDGPGALARAFEELEERPDFDVLRRLELQPGEAPTLAVLASERGVTRQRIRDMQARIHRALAREAQGDYRPIWLAAEGVRARLGPVARVEEPDAVFASIDPDGGALRASSPHRGALLLLLADYRISGPWVLGPDIESLTRIVLLALDDDGRGADLDAVRRHLSRLGIREEIHLPWILDQHGFRIVDGRVSAYQDLE